MSNLKRSASRGPLSQHVTIQVDRESDSQRAGEARTEQVAGFLECSAVPRALPARSVPPVPCPIIPPDTYYVQGEAGSYRILKSSYLFIEPPSLLDLIIQSRLARARSACLEFVSSHNLLNRTFRWRLNYNLGISTCRLRRCGIGMALMRAKNTKKIKKFMKKLKIMKRSRPSKCRSRGPGYWQVRSICERQDLLSGCNVHV